MKTNIACFSKQITRKMISSNNKSAENESLKTSDFDNVFKWSKSK